MIINRFILSIFLTTTCGLVYAKCLLQADSEDQCRFPSGDAWCAEYGNGNSYAYSDECLKYQAAEEAHAAEEEKEEAAAAFEQQPIERE